MNRAARGNLGEPINARRPGNQEAGRRYNREVTYQEHKPLGLGAGRVIVDRSQPKRSVVKMEARNPGRGRFFVGVVSAQ